MRDTRKRREQQSRLAIEQNMHGKENKSVSLRTQARYVQTEKDSKLSLIVGRDTLAFLEHCKDRYI